MMFQTNVLLESFQKGNCLQSLYSSLTQNFQERSISPTTSY